MPSVVAPEHDDRVLRASRGLQRRCEPRHLTVHEADARQISAHERPPLTRSAQRAQPRLRQLPVQKVGELWQIRAVILLHGRHLQIRVRIQIKPLLRSKTRHVRQAETRRDEERFVRRSALQRIDRAVGDLPIRVVRIALRKHTPVHRRMTIRPGQIGEWLLRLRHGPAVSPFEELRFLIAAAHGAIVVDFSAVEGPVTRAGEGLRQRHVRLRLFDLTNSRREAVNARRTRPQTRQQRTARRIAQRRLAMRVREQRAASRQRIDARCFHLRMPAQAANPVVLVINGDEKHVWTRIRRAKRGGEAKQQQGKFHGAPANAASKPKLTENAVQASRMLVSTRNPHFTISNPRRMCSE